MKSSSDLGVRGVLLRSLGWRRPVDVELEWDNTRTTTRKSQGWGCTMKCLTDNPFRRALMRIVFTA